MHASGTGQGIDGRHRTGHRRAEDPREPTIIDLRDRALISVMVHSFARVSATLAMKVEDYYPQGKRWWFRLHEKGGKRHQVPAHHNAEKYVDAYLQQTANIRGQLTNKVVTFANNVIRRPRLFSANLVRRTCLFGKRLA